MQSIAPGTGSARLLEGKHAVVTGGSRGIGFAIARSLAHAGAFVHMIARTSDEISEAARVVGEHAIAYACDITDDESVKRMSNGVLQACNATLDILVNSAGVFPLRPLMEMETGEFDSTVTTNLVGPFRVARAFLPSMHANGSGHIVTVGSVADRTILPGNGAYSASKFGQRALHEVLRIELRASGVRVSLISPSATDTPIWDPIDPDNRPGFPSRTEMLRASDVADAVLWTVTRDARVNVDELRLSAS